MEYEIGRALGAVFGVAIFGGILTGIAVVFGKAIGKPLNKAQKISTFVVTSLLLIAAFMYERFSR